jgi:hypothetical protein
MASADFDLCYLTATEAMRSIGRFKSKKPSPVETDERRARAMRGAESETQSPTIAVTH